MLRFHRLSTIESTIAMPMHPSNTYTIHELQANAADILHAVQEEANKQIKGAKMNLDSKFTMVPSGSIRARSQLRRRHLRQHLRRCRHPAGSELRQRCFHPEHLSGFYARPERTAQEWPCQRSGQRRCHHARVLLRPLLRCRRPHELAGTEASSL